MTTAMQLGHLTTGVSLLHRFICQSTSGPSFLASSKNTLQERSHGSDFEKVSRCQSEFPSNLCKSSGHAVVVMGYSKDCQGKIVYKIKNSWGEDFASKGYFYIEADGLTCGFYEFVDVFYYVPYLPPADIRNYLVHLLSKDTLWRFDKSGLTELPGCSSRFEFVAATERSCSHQ